MQLSLQEQRAAEETRTGQGERLAREKDQNPNVDKPNEGLLTGDCQGIGRIRFLSWREEEDEGRGRKKEKG